MLDVERMDCSSVMCECPCCVNVQESCIVANLITRVPIVLFERIHSRLLTPFLLNFSDLSPALFPRKWVSSPPHLARTGDSLRAEFCYMCQSVSGWRALVRDGHIDAFQLIASLTSRGENLLAWLTIRGRIFGARGPTSDALKLRIRLQVRQIRGVDSIFFRLYGEVLAITCCMRSPSLDAMVWLATETGSVDRMRSLALDFGAKFAGQNSAVVAYMAQLTFALDGHKRTERRSLLAVAMALHPRLGDASPLAQLGQDLLPLCLPRACEPLLGWRDVLDGCV